MNGISVMKMLQLLKQLTLTAFLFSVTFSTGIAGGPLSLAGPGGHTPVTYPNGGRNIQLNFDLGPLGSRTNTQADALIDTAIGLWTNNATSTVQLLQGADLPVDVDQTNFSSYLSNFLKKWHNIGCISFAGSFGS